MRISDYSIESEKKQKEGLKDCFEKIVEKEELNNYF